MGQWQYTPPPEENRVPVGQGYAVDTPDPRNRADASANAYLQNQVQDQLKLIITEVGIDFSASGKTLQSRLYRQFLYRNFGVVSLAIRGQCRSQKDLGKLAEFVYQSHRLAVADTSRVGDPLISLIIASGGRDTLRGQKGSYKGIDVQGHIEGFTRRHERWVNAPAWQFNFIVENWKSGIGPGLTDEKVKAKYLATYVGFANNVDKGLSDAFAPDPDGSPVLPHHGTPALGAGNVAAKPGGNQPAVAKP